VTVASLHSSILISASLLSSVDLILRPSRIASVLRSVIFMAGRWSAPALTKLRAEVRRKSCGVSPSRTFALRSYFPSPNFSQVAEIAVRFHHRLVWIHPFPNGNGRHPRLLADVIVMKRGREQFTWGSRELVDVGPARAEYIRCLKAADANIEDIQGLLIFARS
jgi:hypothetical protein